MCPSGRTIRPERSEFRPAFDVLDADRDGKISRDDLRTFYSGFATAGAGGSDEDDLIGSMITVADSNKDGFVEYDEFERVLGCRSDPRGGNDGGVMEEVFKIMDRDGDGKVGRDDLKNYLNWAGFSANDEDINAMIRLGGGDANGGVTYEGLLRILAVDRFE